LSRARAAVVLLFLLVNLAWFAWSRAQTGADTPRYIDGAARLVDGRPLEDIQAVHAGYLALVALCHSAGVGTTAVVLIQIGVAAIAVAAVGQLGCALAGPSAGLIAAALFACDIETARWHRFVLTDSLYLSLLPIAVWTVHRAVAERVADWRHMLAAAVSLAALAALRLEGWLVPPLAALHWAAHGAGGRVRRAAGVAVVLLGATLLLAVMPKVHPNAEWILPVDSLLSGQTIWGSDRWTIAMPPGRSSGLEYAATHPAKTSALLLARVAVHLVHVRPFYSVMHNALILVWLVPVYAFAVLGWQYVRHQPLAHWLLSAIAVQTAIVAITHADWDGRPLAHVLPLIYVLSACGAAHVLTRRGSGSTMTLAPQ
jgi:hypothetical protein